MQNTVITTGAWPKGVFSILYFKNTIVFVWLILTKHETVKMWSIVMLLYINNLICAYFAKRHIIEQNMSWTLNCAIPFLFKTFITNINPSKHEFGTVFYAFIIASQYHSMADTDWGWRKRGDMASDDDHEVPLSLYKNFLIKRYRGSGYNHRPNYRYFWIPDITEF